MEDLLLMSGLFAAGAGIGAMFSYARDRNLLRLYSSLVEDLSSMIPRAASQPPDDPAAAARMSALPPLPDPLDRRAS
jgi:hypothetical protein